MSDQFIDYVRRKASADGAARCDDCLIQDACACLNREDTIEPRKEDDCLAYWAAKAEEEYRDISAEVGAP